MALIIVVIVLYKFNMIILLSNIRSFLAINIDHMCKLVKSCMIKLWLEVLSVALELGQHIHFNVDLRNLQPCS